MCNSDVYLPKFCVNLVKHRVIMSNSRAALPTQFNFSKSHVILSNTVDVSHNNLLDTNFSQTR